MRLKLVQDALHDPRVIAFLAAHLDDMRAVSPPESSHALDLDGLRQPSVTFWSAWLDGELVGCVALKQLDATHAELKSMRTTVTRRRTGIGAQLLAHAETTARQRGYTQISLETGSMDFFAPARALYARHGFVPCSPFADYQPDPNSVFMTRML